MEEIEQLTIGLQFAQSLIRNDMRGRIERRLHRELDRVDDEPFLAYVLFQEIEPRERSQLGHARLDEREPLEDEVAVNHGPEARWPCDSGRGQA